jgi:hypothetical protein
MRGNESMEKDIELIEKARFQWVSQNPEYRPPVVLLRKEGDVVAYYFDALLIAGLIGIHPTFIVQTQSGGMFTNQYMIQVNAALAEEVARQVVESNRSCIFIGDFTELPNTLKANVASEHREGNI